jgi:ribulose-phosphate 3-epimerase
MAPMMPKIQQLRALKPYMDIEVDGGLGPDTIEIAAQAGANMIVAGSAIFKSDPQEVITILRQAVDVQIKK